MPWADCKTRWKTDEHDRYYHEMKPNNIHSTKNICYKRYLEVLGICKIPSLELRYLMWAQTQN